jgi:hypothetical protein
LAQIKLSEINEIMGDTRKVIIYIPRPHDPGPYSPPKVNTFQSIAEHTKLDTVEMSELFQAAMAEPNDLIIDAFKEFLMRAKLIYTDAIETAQTLHSDHQKHYKQRMECYERAMISYQERLEEQQKRIAHFDFYTKWKKILDRYQTLNPNLADAADKLVFYSLARSFIPQNRKKAKVAEYDISDLQDMVDWKVLSEIKDPDQLNQITCMIKGNVSSHQDLVKLVQD